MRSLAGDSLPSATPLDKGGEDAERLRGDSVAQFINTA
jgi:hypothetical protein